MERPEPSPGWYAIPTGSPCRAGGPHQNFSAPDQPAAILSAEEEPEAVACS